MNNLIFYSVLLSLLLTSANLMAQEDEAIVVTPTDQPYPAGNQPANASIAAFISVFDDTNVGNLHVFSTQKEEPTADYFFQGTDITGSFNDVLPEDLKSSLRRTGGKIHAVRNVRGVDGEYYILRIPNATKMPQLKMYELRGTKLVELLTLADIDCKDNGRCTQVDSWIQDVDGDTRLDVIQRRAKMRDGQSKKIKTTVYMLDRSGNFRKSRSVDIDENSYMMEKM